MAEVRKLRATDVHLPDEILVEIFLKLPVRSLLLFKLVCKHWLRLITNSHFIQMHIDRPIDHCHDHSTILVAHAIDQDKIVLTLLSDDENLSYEDELPLEFMSRSMGSDIFNLDRLHLLGPCNGLFCLTNKKEIVVFNPITRRCRNVSRSGLTPYLSFLSSVCVGFGHDCVSGDYKVVRFDEDIDNNNVYNHDFWDNYDHDVFEDDDIIMNDYNYCDAGLYIDYDVGDYFDCNVGDYSDNDTASIGDYHVGMDTNYDVDGHDYDVGDNIDYIVGDDDDYDIGDDDYDVNHHHVHFRVDIYSLRNNNWRVLDCIIPPGNISGSRSHSLFVNGALHWLHASSILVFDLNEEAFKWFKLADTYTEGDGIGMYLSVLIDSLAMIVHRKLDQLNMFAGLELWVMMEYGVRTSWRKLYNISPDVGIERPLSFSKKEEFLIEIRYGKSAMGYGKLALFNFKTKAIKLFNIEACTFLSFNTNTNNISWAPGLVNAFQFRESLVSLK